MNCKRTVVLYAILIALTAESLSFAAVESSIIKTLPIAASPLDTEISSDGRYIYVLAEDGNVYIYTADGTLQDKINVGKQIDQIKIGPSGEYLLVSSRQNKTIQVVALKFIYDIDTLDSPFRGAADAPVVVAVFSDFQ
jgi:DNA-binding beta-propeller fold protein YncE